MSEESASGRSWVPYAVVGAVVGGVALAGAGVALYFFFKGSRHARNPMERLARKGDLRGLRRLAQQLDEEGNLEQARECYIAAARQGDAASQTQVGLLLSANLPPSSIKQPQLLEPTYWWRLAAQQGDARAQVLLADSLFAAGSEDEALVWLRKAAQQENVQAQLKLGLVLHLRHLDEEEALKWLTKAVYNGATEANGIVEEMTRRMTEKSTQQHTN
jgi:TPR repeat protein